MNTEKSYKQKVLLRPLSVLLVMIMLIACVLPQMTTMVAAAPTKYTLAPRVLTLPLDLKLDITMRVIVDPFLSNNEVLALPGLTFASSNTAVATIDSKGTITLVGEGVTNITATIPGVPTGAIADVDDAAVVFPASSTCLLTVTPAENRSLANHNLMNLPNTTVDYKANNPTVAEPAKGRYNIISDLLVLPTTYGQAKIAVWKDNATAVNAPYADDNNWKDIPLWEALQEEYGYPVTHGCALSDRDYLSSSYIDQLDKWEATVRNGNGLESHTKFHSAAQGKFTTAQWIDQTLDSRDILDETLYGPKLLSPKRAKFYLPGNGGGNMPEYSRPFFVGNRNGPYQVNPGSFSDYMSVGAVSYGDFSNLTTMQSSVESAIQKNGSIAVLCHNINGEFTHDKLGPGTTHPDLFQYMYKNFMIYNNFWGATISDMTVYSQERDNARITDMNAGADTISFNVIDDLDDIYYDFPLTINVCVDDTWNSVTATQNGTAVDAKLYGSDGKRYVAVDAVPDRGLVVLTRSGSGALSNSTKLESFTYVTGVKETAVRKSEFKTVTGFDSNANEGTYTVLLDSDTTSVAFYPDVADPNAKVTRNPAMGIIDNLKGGETRTVTTTVTAQDGTKREYKINFVVEGYAPITKLDIHCTTGNLEHEGVSQMVGFAAVPTPLKSKVDEATVKWYINGVEQTTIGYAFKFDPLLDGTYDVYAKAGETVSNTLTVNYDPGPPVADKVIFEDDFEEYTVGETLPTGGSNKWTENGVYYDRKFIAPFGNYKVVNDPEGKFGKVAKTSVKGTTIEASDIEVGSTMDGFVMAAKIRSEGAGGLGYQTKIGLLGWQRWGGYAPSWLELAHNGTVLALGNQWGLDNWAIDKDWVSLLVYVSTEKDAGGNSYIETYFSVDGTVAHRTTTGDFAGYAGTKPHLQFIAEAGGGVKDTEFQPAYLTDVKLYYPGNFTMRPENETGVELSESVKVLFNHHFDYNTLTKERVTVTSASGTAAIASIDKSAMDPDYFVINFQPGALQANEVYTITLSSDVRDIAHKTIHGPAQFATVGSSWTPPPTPTPRPAKTPGPPATPPPADPTYHNLNDGAKTLALTDGNITITGTYNNTAGQNIIDIPANYDGVITFDSININSNVRAIRIGNNAKVRLVLKGDNTITNTGGEAIHLPVGRTLIVTEDSVQGGSLTVTGGGGQSATIGGAHSETFGTLVIESGTITVSNNLGNNAAVGGGNNGGGGGTVIVKGGTFNVTSGNGAAIGGGHNGGSGGTFVVTGGTVNAMNNRTTWAATIGGGFGNKDGKSGDSGNIIITGGTVNALKATNDGGGSGPGLGSSGAEGAGAPGQVNNIIITGGTVTAQAANHNNGQCNAAAIGSGGFNANYNTANAPKPGGNIIITGGSVTAYGGYNGVGIGGPGLNTAGNGVSNVKSIVVLPGADISSSAFASKPSGGSPNPGLANPAVKSFGNADNIFFLNENDDAAKLSIEALGASDFTAETADGDIGAAIFANLLGYNTNITGDMTEVLGIMQSVVNTWYVTPAELKMGRLNLAEVVLGATSADTENKLKLKYYNTMTAEGGGEITFTTDGWDPVVKSGGYLDTKPVAVVFSEKGAELPLWSYSLVGTPAEKLEVSANVSLDESGVLIAALYKGGVLIRVAVEPVTADGAKSAEITLPAGFEQGQNWEVRAFIWDGLTTMKPLLTETLVEAL